MKTGKLEYRKVTRLVPPHQDRLIELHIAGETTPLRPTPSHPFFVKRAGKTEGEWIKAADLKIGDRVLDRHGKWRSVTAISPVEKPASVYNFEVEETHNYFVGPSGILVHNGPCDRLALGKTEGLAEFADSVEADTYETLRLTNEPLDEVLNIMSDSEVEIHVQLIDASGNTAPEVENVASGVNSIAPTPFEQELQLIYNHPEWAPRITFYEGSKVVPWPF